MTDATYFSWPAIVNFCYMVRLVNPDQNPCIKNKNSQLRDDCSAFSNLFYLSKLQAASDSEDEEVVLASDTADVESESSLWEKLEPPVRRSPLTLNAAVVIKPETAADISAATEEQSTSRDVPGMMLISYRAC